MSEAQLEIKLVDDNADAQEAFSKESPKEQAAPAAVSSPVSGSTDKTDSQAEKQVVRQQEQQGRQTDTLISSIDSLVESINDLIESQNKETERKVKPPPVPSTKPDDEPKGLSKILKQFDNAIQQTLRTFNLNDTVAGKVVSRTSGLVRKQGERVIDTAKTAAQKLADSKLGRGVREAGKRLANTRAGKAVTRAGTGIATRLGLGGASAAAGSSAAASGGAAAGASVAAIAGPVAVAGAALVAFGFTVKKVSDKVNALATEIEDLSPAISTVRAIAENNRELNRLERSQRISPEVAQMEAARARLSESMYTVQTNIYAILLKMAPLFEVGFDAINIGVNAFNMQVTQVEKIIALLTVWDQDDDREADKAHRRAQLEFFKSLKDFMTMQGRGDVQQDPFFDNFFNMGPDPGPPHPDHPVDPAVPDAHGNGGGH